MSKAKKTSGFTDRFIKNEKAKPNQLKPRDIREGSGNGFVITVFPSGEKSFVYIYHFQGRKRRMTLGKYPHMSLSDAKQAHRAALKVLESGKDPAIEKKKALLDERSADTVNSLANEFLEVWAKPRKKSWQEDERILNRDILPVWGKQKAKDITKRDVILLLEKIVKRGAPIGANRTLACIRRMFNFGVERDLLTASPCATVRAPSKENRRERSLSVEEIRYFWHILTNKSYGDSTDKTDITSALKMSESTKLVLKLLLITAQRKGEIVGAEWRDIDFSTNVWTIPSEKAKNKKTHRVPLSELAIELLEEIKQFSNGSRWLFPAATTVKKDIHMTSKAIDHALRRNAEAFSDIEAFSPHDLRRTAATHMASMRISSDILSRILNHSKQGVTEQHYNQYNYDDEKRDALNRWADRLKQIIDQASTPNNVIKLKI